MIEKAILTVDGVGVETAQGRPLLRDVSFSVAAGEVFGIIGPNGAGKTTLLRCLAQAASPARGTVGVDGHDLRRLPARMLARLVAMVPQESPSGQFLRVRDMVALGRLPHLGTFQTLTRRDKAVVADAMASMDVEALADRRISSLSGGERQRVMVARAIAQETGILILDEPGNHLDVRHRLDLMRRVCGMGKTVILTLHDLESAGRDCSRLLLLERGRVAACGPAASVLTPALIRRVFQVEAEILLDPRQGAPWLAFYLPSESRSEEPA